MKKIMFVALALLMGLASCVKDKQYSGIKISNVTYAPNPATEEDDVTVSATITCLKAFTAQLFYAVNDGETITLALLNLLVQRLNSMWKPITTNSL